jgi:peptidoglycan/xylan/chitin deacetylase (PgdA/CDA1 family)
MAELRFCHRHPAQIAKRRCFQCSAPICQNCQIKIDHHLFCGNSCHAEYLKAALRKTRSAYSRYATYATLILLFGGFIYFALLADAFYSGGELEVKSNLAQIAPSLPVDMQENPSAEILISSPLNGMSSSSQTVQVEGRAPHNSAVAMYLDGTLMDSTVARGGHYQFPDVPLNKHVNVLQTRFYARNGSSDSSSPIMIFLQNSSSATNPDPPFFRNSSDNISRGNLNRKEIVMTFDGDSEANSCVDILKTLEETNIRTTIFLTSEFMEKFPYLTREIAEKHEVGNQIPSPAITREQLQNQLRQTEELFQRVTGKRMALLWRTSFEEQNLEMRKWAAELGYTHVAWTTNSRNHQNMDSLDSVPNESVEGYFPALLMKDRLLTFGQNEMEQANGAIILMHLGSQRDPGDRLDKWLPEIIKTFRHKGYQFITATELIAHNSPALNAVAP